MTENQELDIDRIVEEAMSSNETTESVHEVIPPNSESLLIDEGTSRFNSAIWFENIKNQKVLLAGLGGIGSYVAYLLSRLKIHSLYMYDNDVIDTGNMSGQFYPYEEIGNYKVEAINNLINKFSNYYSVCSFNEKYTEESITSDIMICGFDNMKARKIFFNKWLEHVKNYPEENRGNCLFIDGRLAAEELQVLCIQGNDEFNIKRYQEEFLFTDEEAEATLCSYKQTTFMANMIGSIIVNLFVNFVAINSNDLRDLPFITTYDAKFMFFKTEV